MSEKVDARGLSCPQPVVITCKKMEKIGAGTIEVLVDAAASRDNIKRMATNQGWQVEIQEKEDEFLLVLTKS
ncbi:MAG: sulfurtransferase TusA family protein [Thermodesulfobacteriota bacterium]|nr:sulfurtransferase TusA family protein [Thermodesulfobacteriota bacterium]